MITYRWYSSLSPGNEQKLYWSSDAAKQKGTRNYAAIQDKKVDQSINEILSSKQYSNLIKATQKLDKALMSGYYVIPLHHSTEDYYAIYNHIKMPKKHSLYGLDIETLYTE
jgi:peptide/nickel transport system substrate-binding protein